MVLGCGILREHHFYNINTFLQGFKVDPSAMSKRLRTDISSCCPSTTAMILLHLVIMPTVCAKSLLPCSPELFELVEAILKDTVVMSSIEERLYTPNETDYKICPTSTLACFADEVKVLVYHSPALRETLLTRRLMSINTRKDSGRCRQCEANNLERAETFLSTLRSILQQINAYGCGRQP
ncbi:interleukin 15, like isoform X2 [Conger conger]|uniref:interleukin 15, like isoform X2 n=1 Tax=Conger conger TaxID=82655 RepID=UPI002A5AA770|nr:interleukin 15, like isoform X2 [Conger conger]